MDITSLLNLSGEVFPGEGGRVAVAVPPKGAPKAILFTVVQVVPCVPGTDDMDWADVVFGPYYFRVNPSICQPPFLWLANCLVFASARWDRLPLITPDGGAVSVSVPSPPDPCSKKFVLAKLDAQEFGVVFIDTYERAVSRCVKNGSSWKPSIPESPRESGR